MYKRDGKPSNWVGRGSERLDRTQTETDLWNEKNNTFIDDGLYSRVRSGSEYVSTSIITISCKCELVVH